MTKLLKDTECVEKFDIIVIIETEKKRCNTSHKAKELKKAEKWGRVALFVTDTLKCYVSHSAYKREHRSVWVEIKQVKEINSGILVVYRPPNFDIEAASPYCMG